ncbi:MAG: CHAP domain-containing protein [Alphaproteobacteria bacterium]
MRPLFAVFLGGVLAACASQPIAPRPQGPKPVVLLPPSPLKPYPDTSGFLQCVPFARAVSGVDLRGDAWTWWEQAEQRYSRGYRPKVGSVLVFRRTNRLKRGHVAVVADVSDARSVLLTHANWGHEGDTRGVVHERQPVIDVSPNNDWTQVRLMNRNGTYGSVYPAYGFIYQAPGGERTTTTTTGESTVVIY